MTQTILVCGGAGYIGAHMCEQLAERGYRVVVFDNLAGGHREAVRWGDLIVGDLLDPRAIDAAFDAHRIDAVMHFAGKIVVGESTLDPATYYENNVTGTLNLLQSMLRHGSPPLVFSSTAAVYGDPLHTPIDEEHPCVPVNPYGCSKWIIERVLADFRRAYSLRSVSLRYFNAAGASPSGLIGETHDPETHLIPNVLQACVAGLPVDVFGNDYPTSDGTCVRDYVHVADLCRAHLGALEYLTAGGENEAINLGSQRGFSVLEVVAAAERICGRTIARRVAARREGDPPILVASAQKARETLGWIPVESGLESIIGSAWRWEQQRPPVCYPDTDGATYPKGPTLP
jgi:UDP-glucose 4-epimerase